jgi:hypothetical protein
MDKKIRKIEKEMKGLEKMDKKRDKAVEMGRKCSAGHMKKKAK